MTSKYIEFHLASRLGVVGIIEFDHEAGKRVAKTPRMTLYTAEDADRLIAALREARDALAGDAARDDGARIDATVLPHSEYGEWNQQLEAQRYGAPASAAPSRATDAAPERAATRLTRAQRELMERIERAPNYPYTASSSVWRRTQALLNRGLIAQGRQEPGHRPICILTDAGRAALAAAQRETGDARDATRDGGGER